MSDFMSQHALAICLSISILSTSVGYGQVMLSPAFEKSDAAADEAAAQKSVTLFPRMSPDPKLHYRLWPAPEKRRSRSAMVAVNRALLLVAQVSSTQKRRFLEGYDLWSTLPVNQLPVDEAKSSYRAFQTAIEVLRSGENWMDLKYDLGLEDMSSREKIATLLPEYQEMRDLARLLCIRARVAAAERRWDDTVSDLRLGFRLSEVASQGTDTLLSRLIGIAIADVMMDTIHAMIQIPDCPNLYWALAGLPVDRLFEMREALEYESTLASHIGNVADLPELPEEIIGEDKALIRIKEIADAYSTDFQSPETPAATLSLRQMSTGIYITMMVQPSRELLAESPLWKDRVAELSDAEAVLRASDFELSRIRENWLAWSSLPPYLWKDYEKELSDAMKAASRSNSIGARFARLTLPSVRRAASVGLEAKQKHHRLITLEALRLHAAGTGSLPESIDRLSPAPAWKDPLSGESFGYVRKSTTQATITRAAGSGNQNDLELEIILKGSQ